MASLGFLDKALHDYRESGEIQVAIGEHSSGMAATVLRGEYAVTLQKVAQVFARQGRYADALNWYRQYAEMQKTMSGEASMEYASALQHVSQMLHMTGRY